MMKNSKMNNTNESFARNSLQNTPSDQFTLTSSTRDDVNRLIYLDLTQPKVQDSFESASRSNVGLLTPSESSPSHSLLYHQSHENMNIYSGMSSIASTNTLPNEATMQTQQAVFHKSIFQQNPTLEENTTSPSSLEQTPYHSSGEITDDEEAFACEDGSRSLQLCSSVGQ